MIYTKAAKYISWITLLLLLHCVSAQSHHDHMAALKHSRRDLSDPSSKCLTYPGGLCSAYVNYPIFIGNNSIESIEKQLIILNNVTQWFDNIIPSCVDAYYRYTCSLAYPKCIDNPTGSPNFQVACKSACDDVTRICTNIFIATNSLQALPNCNANSTFPNVPLQSDATCNIIKPLVISPTSGFNLSAIPSDYIAYDCPAPFIRDPSIQSRDGTKSTNIYCYFGCCVPCPVQNYFYKAGWTETGFLVTNIIRIISAIVTLPILLSYLILPDKRGHPSILILNLSLVVFIFCSTVLFSIEDPHSLQCANAVDVSTQDNNLKCAAQGGILIFSSVATICWGATLILNLHLHAVWNSNFLAQRYTMLHIFCWGIPLICMSTALGLHSVKFEFANLCLVSVDRVFEIIFYPMAVIICPSFLIHLSTFFYIAKIAIREGLQSEISQSKSNNSDPSNEISMRLARHKHVITAVRIQWRALLLAVVACATLLFYWIFYFTQVTNLSIIAKDGSFVSHWVECMLTNAKDNREICFETIEPYLPPFGLMIAAEILVSFVGFWIVLIFGRRSLWQEWCDLFYDLQERRSPKAHGKKVRDEFIEL